MPCWANGCGDLGLRRLIFGGRFWLQNMGLIMGVGSPIDLEVPMVVVFGSILGWDGMVFPLMLVWAR